MKEQESRPIAKKSRDAAAVRCGLKFADIHYSVRIANPGKPGFRALDIPAHNKIAIQGYMSQWKGNGLNNTTIMLALFPKVP